jgi:excisionase family DNA binding protein
MTSRKPLLTVDEVAAALCVSRSTVWRLADAGRLCRVRVGPARRLVRFNVQDIDALIAAGSIAEPSGSAEPAYK